MNDDDAPPFFVLGHSALWRPLIVQSGPFLPKKKVLFKSKKKRSRTKNKA